MSLNSRDEVQGSSILYPQATAARFESLHQSATLAATLSGVMVAPEYLQLRTAEIHLEMAISWQEIGGLKILIACLGKIIG